MIQRKQSLFLLLGILLMGISLPLNWSTYLVENEFFNLNGLGTSVAQLSAYPLTVGIVVSIVLMLVVLFMYKNRVQQMRLINIAILQLFLTLGLFSFVHYQAIEAMKVNFNDVQIGYGMAMAYPLISVVLLWLAKKAIKKDEDLVRSVDRLR